MTDDKDDKTTDPVGDGAVPYEKYRALLDEKKKEAAKRKALEKEVEELKAKIEELTTKKATDDGNIKELVEAAQKKIEELTGKLEEKTKKEQELFKKMIMARVQAKAIKEGLKDLDYIQLIIDKVEVDEETGEVDEDSLKELFDKLKAEKPYLFEAGESVLRTDSTKPAAKQSPEGENLENLSPVEKIRMGLEGRRK